MSSGGRIVGTRGVVFKRSPSASPFECVGVPEMYRKAALNWHQVRVRRVGDSDLFETSDRTALAIGPRFVSVKITKAVEAM